MVHSDSPPTLSNFQHYHSFTFHFNSHLSLSFFSFLIKNFIILIISLKFFHFQLNTHLQIWSCSYACHPPPHPPIFHYFDFLPITYSHLYNLFLFLARFPPLPLFILFPIIIYGYYYFFSFLFYFLQCLFINSFFSFPLN